MGCLSSDELSAVEKRITKKELYRTLAAVIVAGKESSAATLAFFEALRKYPCDDPMEAAKDLEPLYQDAVTKAEAFLAMLPE